MSTDVSENISLVDAIKSFVQGTISDTIHTSLPGVIESYDSKKRLAKVTPQIKKKYNDGSELIYKPIDNVPVIFIGAGSSGLRLPESEYKGQNCLILFCEQSIDFWKAKGELTDPGNSREFHISDAVAIVGLNSFNNTDDGGNELVLFWNDAKITISSDNSIKAENSNGNYELKANGQFAVNGTNLTVEP
jgi:hypothetical protein